MAYRKDWTQPQAGNQGFARTNKTYGRRVAIAVADNVTGNTVGAFMVPAGFTVLSIIAVGTDMDSGAAMLLNIGDAALATRFITGLNTQAAVTAVAFTTVTPGTNVLFTYTNDTEILVTVATQAGTAVAGTVDIYLTGFIANP
jgi:hypothetical protein